MPHLVLPGTGIPSLSARIGASRSAGERVCSRVESQATGLLGTGALTSLSSRPCHWGHMAYLPRP